MAGEGTKGCFSPPNRPERAGRSTGGLQPIQMVDQLTEPTGAPSVEIEDQPWEVPQRWFIKLFVEWATQFELPVGQEVAEPFPGLFELFAGDRRLQPHHQLSPNEPNGVIPAIEHEDMAHGRIGRIHDREETQVLFIDQLSV